MQLAGLVYLDISVYQGFSFNMVFQKYVRTPAFPVQCHLNNPTIKYFN